MADLFSAAAEARLRATAPLAARLRPRTIDDVVGQDHLVGQGRPLRRLVEGDRLTSAEKKELAELRRRNRQLEMENDILKRAAAYFFFSLPMISGVIIMS